MSRVRIVITVVVLMGAIGAAVGAELPPAAATALDKAQVPIHPDAVFCIGSPEAGLRFATAADPAAVRSWYVDKLPGWARLEDANLGIWVLYDGLPDLDSMADVMAFNHIAVQANENLPQWHDLPAGTTTEIMIMAILAAAPATEGALAVIPALEGWQAPDLPRQTAADGFVGTLHRGQDMYSETERYYFYLQDEDYNERVVAHEDEIPAAVATRLDALAGD